MVIVVVVVSPGAFAVLLHQYNNASSHGGYGYLSTSETDAMSDLNFDCSRSSQRARSRVCGANMTLPGDQAIDHLDPVIGQLSSGEIRKTYLEHLTMQLSALNYRPGADLPLTCMSGTQEHSRYTQLRNGVTPAYPGLAGERQRVVAEQLNDESTLSAFVMDDYYRRAWAAQTPACNASSRVTTCVALMNSFLKLRSTHPQLYQQLMMEDAPTFPPVRRELVTRELRPIVEALIGGDTLSVSSGDARMLRDSGAVSIQQTLSGGDVRGPDRLMARILANYRGGNQRAVLQIALANIRGSYQSDLVQQLRGVCPDRGNPISTAEMLALDPAAVRQALLNANNSESRTAIEYDLCHSPAFRIMRNIGCSTQCDKQTGHCETVAPREMDIVRANETFSGQVMADYPFSSSASYGITRTPPLRRGNATIRTTIQVTPPTGATPAEAAAHRARLQACVATWFNDQARSNGNPNLTFQIQFIGKDDALPAGSPPPVAITLRTCYHSTCSFRGTPTQSMCCPGNAPSCAIPGEANHGMQADSANLMADTNCAVVRHEVGHMLGLPDEYQADYYPFNSLGEPNSIMNNSSETSRLYPRHFWSMLHPNRCK